jgi:hypothetical protein
MNILSRDVRDRYYSRVGKSLPKKFPEPTWAYTYVGIILKSVGTMIAKLVEPSLFEYTTYVEFLVLNSNDGI